MRFRSVLMAVVLILGLGAVTPQQAAAQPQWRLLYGTEAKNWRDLSAYAMGESILPGEPLQLKVHSAAKTVTVDVFRVGWYNGNRAKLVAQAPARASVRQPECPVIDRTVDCTNWTVTHTFDTTGWEPGMYLSKIVDNLGRGHYDATVVRSRTHDGAVTLMSSTATHAAYNNVGGYSLYVGPTGGGGDRAHTVSLNRPSRGNGAQEAFTFEIGLIQEIERLGLKLSYTTNGALHRGAENYRGSRALVALGHDEYWSVPMRNAAQTLRDRGTNLIVLGSNTMFYRARWNSDLTRLTSYKTAATDPVQGPETTEVFRSAPNPNPEARLLGSQYDCDGRNPQTDLVVVNPNFWAFRGTGATAGARYPNLIGHEVDKAGPDSPPGVHIAAHSSFNCRDRGGWSDLTYYVAPSKAGVLNLGTMGFDGAT